MSIYSRNSQWNERINIGDMNVTIKCNLQKFKQCTCVVRWISAIIQSSLMLTILFVSCLPNIFVHNKYTVVPLWQPMQLNFHLLNSATHAYYILLNWHRILDSLILQHILLVDYKTQTFYNITWIFNCHDSVNLLNIPYYINNK